MCFPFVFVDELSANSSSTPRKNEPVNFSEHRADVGRLRWFYCWANMLVMGMRRDGGMVRYDSY